MIILSLLAALFWGPEMQARIKDFKQARVDVMIEEIRRIGTLAQGFALENNGNWPDQGNQCTNNANLILRGSLNRESPLYSGPAATGQTMPFMVPRGVPAKLGYYYFHCAEDRFSAGSYPEFTVRIALANNDKRWSHYIVNQFAGSSVLNGGDYTGIEISWPLPAAIPLLNTFLPRDGSLAMQGDLDMDNHVLHQVKDIFLETGQTLASVPFVTWDCATWQPNC